MRPIKFRAWIPSCKKMGAPFDFRENMFDSGPIENHYDVFPRDAVLMQFTGLRDKKGREIFEGDILREDHYGAPSLFIVEWDQLWARFSLRHDKRAIQYPEWNRGVLMEVVGNIHENQEMMK